MPMRIHAFDQGDLLATSPALDFFFARDRLRGIDEQLVIDQASKVVAAGETRVELILVFENPAGKIPRNSRVQEVRARIVGHDVDVEVLRRSQGRFPDA